MAAEYLSKLNDYKNYLRQHGFDVAHLRVETQFESLRDWSVIGDLGEVIKWFSEQQKNCRMEVEDIPLSECSNWSIDVDTGWIRHKSGEFFVVQGVRVAFSAGREVSEGWDQPIVTQVGYNGGILGLLRKRIKGEIGRAHV